MNTIANKRFLGVRLSLWHDPRTWLVLLAITETSLFRYLMLVLSRLTGMENIGIIVMHTAYVILIGISMIRGSRIRMSDFMILLFVVLSILITKTIYPDNIDKYMFGLGQFWPTVFPLFRFFIVGLFLIPDDETLTLLGKVSCLSVLAESLFVYFFLRGSDLQSMDDMSRSYFILMSVLFVINYAYDKRTLVGITVAIVGVLLLLSNGSRGPVMIVLAFIAAKFFQTSTHKGKGGIVIVVIALLMWFVNSEYWNDLLLFLKSILESLGLSTRIIDFTIQGETLTYYSDRDEIFAIVWKKILERPITGYGVYGEWQFVGWSAHNAYLEILCHYGVIIGSVIILGMIIASIKAFIATKSQSVRSLVLLFACLFFVRGIFGGSFLSFEAFLLIGFCMQILHKSNFRYITE